MARNKSRARIMHELQIENDRLRRELRPDNPFGATRETCNIECLETETLFLRGIFGDEPTEEHLEKIQRKLQRNMAGMIVRDADKYMQFYGREHYAGTIYGMRIFVVRGMTGYNGLE